MKVFAGLLIALSILVNYIVCSTLQDAVHAPLRTFNAPPEKIPAARMLDIYPRGPLLTVVRRGDWMIGYLYGQSIQPFLTHSTPDAVAVAIRISTGVSEEIRDIDFAKALGIFKYLPLHTPHDDDFELPIHFSNHTQFTNPASILDVIADHLRRNRF